jgi:hypothetical protein
MTTTMMTTTAWWWTAQQPYNINFDGRVLIDTISWMILWMILIAPVLLIIFTLICKAVEAVPAGDVK